MRGMALRARVKSCHQDENGQIAILSLFGLFAIVFLIALIFDTAGQTIRKSEMQNASDAAAKAGAINVGRGMNIVASNNRGMTQMISTMIVVRSTLQTAEAMTVILPRMIAAAAFLNPGLAAQLSRELANYINLITVLTPIDRSTERLGWQTMSALDQVNQMVKAGMPYLAQQQAIEFARRNGADQPPHSLLIPGLPTGPPLVMPIARGPQKFIVIEAGCVLDRMKNMVREIFIATGPLSSGIAMGVFDGMVHCNSSTLVNGSSLCQFTAFTPMLDWPANTPRPMLLTDSPPRSPAGTIKVGESASDLAKVRKYLQYLNFSFADLANEGPIGSKYFVNPSSRWVTYAQADVYNPTRWSMFSQDWRAQMVRARLLNEKSSQLSQIIGMPLPSIDGSVWSFVNLH